MSSDWLHVRRGEAPLIVSIPHAGTDIIEPFGSGLVSIERAVRDADWHVDRLYDCAAELGATVVRTSISRTVIDVNRDPSGASLYPGQPTTGLCPLITFDNEPLYREGCEPDESASLARRRSWFDPYHRALAEEIERLRARHRTIVLNDAHSIRSVVPMLFSGTLPELNLGTFNGTACGSELRRAVERICRDSGRSGITDGRFKGGWITRHYGQPSHGVHAIQMETAMRFYLDEQAATGWPPRWDPAYAAPAQALVREILRACIGFAERHG